MHRSFPKRERNQIVIKSRKPLMKRSIPNLVSPYFLTVLYHFFSYFAKTSIFLLVQEYNGASRPKLQRFLRHFIRFQTTVEII
jgi:hypothetical protein